MDDDLNTRSGLSDLSKRFDPSAKPNILVDADRYQAYLDGSDMTDEEKAEFLQALWEIIVGFVELGFGVHPLQEVCGKDAALLSETAKDHADIVCSKEPKNAEKSEEPSPPG